MKRLLSILLFFFILVSTAYADLKPYPFPFTGRWEPSSNPLLINQHGFQDIQNLRKDGNSLKGVSGHSKVTNGIVNSVYYHIRNGFHFTKEQPAESHILVYCQDSTNYGSARIYDNVTAIPNAGDYSGTALHTDASGAGLGRFSSSPQGNVLYCNGVESMVWGGDEYRPIQVVLSDAAAGNSVSNGRDVSNKLNNTSSDADQVATVNSTYKYIIIGATRPLQGMKIYISSANTTVSTLTGKEWDGDSWGAITLTDNTSVGGISLAETDTVTWTSTETTSEPKFLEGLVLYWYEFALSAGTADIYKITLDAAFQDIKNIWDGTEQVISACKVYNGTTYLDYTDEVNDDTTSYVAILDSLDTTHHLLLGFVNKMQGFNIKIPGGKENSTATALTTSWWDGDSWVSVDGLNDGTKVGTTSVARSGVITFSAPSTVYQKQNGDELPLYYYKLSYSVILDVEVEIYYITGIPATDNIEGYKFPGLFEGRAFLFCEKTGHKNKAIYSVYNTTDLWNGPDSGSLFFGNETELTAACTIYNVFRTTGYEQLIVTKANETYRVFGDGPSNWEVQQISGNVGCIAPLSMTVCEITDVSEDTKRHVAIWQSDSGIVMCDGATIVPISEDIRVYWNPNSSLYIPASKQDDSVGWYDSNLNVYKLLVSSGSGQTTHNVELEYSLKYKEWTKVYRENTSGTNPFQVGFQVRDTIGNTYSYGATDEGYIYRTERGATWDGTNICQYVWTKDMLLDNELPFFRHTTVNYMRLMFETKTGTVLSYLEVADGDYLLTEAGNKIVLDYGENITIAHYGDQVLTVDGVDNQSVPESIAPSTGPFEAWDCLLGPHLIHSFKISGDFSTLTDGMELMGMGFGYDPSYTWRVE